MRGIPREARSLEAAMHSVHVPRNGVPDTTDLFVQADAIAAYQVEFAAMLALWPPLMTDLATQARREHASRFDDCRDRSGCVGQLSGGVRDFARGAVPDAGIRVMPFDLDVRDSDYRRYPATVLSARGHEKEPVQQRHSAEQQRADEPMTPLQGASAR